MNLTETRTFTIKVVIALICIIFVYYTGVFVYTVAERAYLAAFPKEPALPESKYGRLPKLKMVSQTINGKPSYTLATKTGTLPSYRDRIKVYKFIKPVANLLSEQNMKKIAAALLFKSEYTKLSTSEFQWVDGDNKRSLTGNVVSENFNLTSDLEKIQTALNLTPTITDKDAISKAISFAKSYALFTKSEFDSITINTIPTVIQLNKLKDAKVVPNQAKMIKVDLFRSLAEYKTVNKKQVLSKLYKIVGENPKESNITIYVTNHRDTFKYPLMDVNMWDIDYTTGSEYFVADIAAVWEAVKKNEGIIAYAKLDDADYFADYTPVDVKNIEIRDIEIGYYEPKESIEYLQPIYIFNGIFETATKSYGELPKKGEIVIYYPAVRGDWVKS